MELLTNRLRATPRLRSGAPSAALTALCCIALMFGMAAKVNAESPEYSVKAAFIYNFAKFVEWPPESLEGDKPFVIGVLGQDPFNNALDETVLGKTVLEKKITVKHFSRIEDALTCHILYISDSEKNNLTEIIKRLDRLPVLTVSDVGQFAERGGMIQLVKEQNRVRIAINTTATNQVGLKPSSQLLKLAQIITGRSR